MGENLAAISADRALPTGGVPEPAVRWRGGLAAGVDDTTIDEETRSFYALRNSRGLRVADVVYDRPQMTFESVHLQTPGARVFLGMDGVLSNPYADILVIGDGGFAFANELSRVRVSTGVARIVATTPDTAEEHSAKYPDGDHAYRSLLVRSVAALFEVPSETIHTHPVISKMRFDYIIWPFPSLNVPRRAPDMSRISMGRVSVDSSIASEDPEHREDAFTILAPRKPKPWNSLSSRDLVRRNAPWAPAAGHGLIPRAGQGQGGGSPRDRNGRNGSASGWRAEGARALSGAADTDEGSVAGRRGGARQTAQQRRESQEDVVGAAHIYGGLMSGCPLLKPNGEFLIPHLRHTDGSPYDISRAARATARLFPLQPEPYPSFINGVVPPLFVPFAAQPEVAAAVHRLALVKEAVRPFDREAYDATRYLLRPELEITERLPPAWLAANAIVSPVPTRAAAATKDIRYLPDTTADAAAATAVGGYVQRLREQRTRSAAGAQQLPPRPAPPSRLGEPL